MTDNPPTPAEIDEALATLRRVPGVRDIDSLGVIARANRPMHRFAAELRVWLGEELPDTAAEMACELIERAARHGLRITADPDPDRGEVIKLALVRQGPDDETWRICTYLHPGEEIPAHLIADGLRVATMYLLPEGGAR
ncbi:hypothetical protein [Nocardia thailandica]|uniref:hypothetical protein n=1 Tax=Nocardia thailandica TaxID=257275 RepID=UPI0002FCA887|nr:hypothetical protein [Nocardia thailandica]